MEHEQKSYTQHKKTPRIHLTLHLHAVTLKANLIKFVVNCNKINKSKGMQRTAKAPWSSGVPIPGTRDRRSNPGKINWYFSIDYTMGYLNFYIIFY